MKTIISITTLLLPVIFLCYRSKIEYEKIFYSTYTNITVLVFFIIYLLSIAYFGANSIDGTDQDLVTLYEGKKYSTFFIFPGISIAIILYPKIFSEYIGNYSNLSSNGLLSATKYIGWLFLIFTIILIYSYKYAN